MSNEKKQNWTDKLFEHSTYRTTKVEWEAGGGEQVAIDEQNASVAEMYAKMVANGTLGIATMHAAANTNVSELRAIAMLKEATVAPQYMEQSEKLKRLRDLKKAEMLLQQEKDAEELRKLQNLNESIEKIQEDKYEVANE